MSHIIFFTTKKMNVTYLEYLHLFSFKTGDDHLMKMVRKDAKLMEIMT